MSAKRGILIALVVLGILAATSALFFWVFSGKSKKVSTEKQEKVGEDCLEEEPLEVESIASMKEELVELKRKTKELKEKVAMCREASPEDENRRFLWLRSYIWRTDLQKATDELNSCKREIENKEKNLREEIEALPKEGDESANPE